MTLQQRYHELTYRSLLAVGVEPVRAEYDAAGNCTVCGEAGRCPGWHDGFTLANDPHAPRPATFDNQDTTRQRVLVEGLDCLPGQLDLF